MTPTRALGAFVIGILIFPLLPPLPLVAAEESSDVVSIHLTSPASAVSVRMLGGVSSVSIRSSVSGRWSDWMTVGLGDDDAPESRESDLVMLPHDAKELQVVGIANADDIHPITVSSAPVSVRTASLVAAGQPFILSRSDWGADPSLLFTAPKGGTDTVGGDIGKGDNGTSPLTSSDQRLNDCQANTAAYPNEFKMAKTVTKDPSGKAYLWPLQYSQSVKLIVLHHAALAVSGDPRPAVERVRAIYKYHAVNRGWGDIGYHYVIDEKGQIYEGRQGGAAVVGGHAFCNNIGTIGVVLLGNFEVEEPTQAQAKSVQRLSDYLADQYHLDLKRPVTFHGKTYQSPVVGHRDLLSTQCPGFSFYGGLPQIRSNLLEGRLDGPVSFPSPPVRSSASSSAPAIAVQEGNFPKVAEGIAFVGRTSISINPGGKQRLSFAYTAPREGAYEGKKIADVRLATSEIQLFVDDGIDQIPVRTGILLPHDLPAGDTLTFQLIVQAPMQSGNYWMEIAGLRFDLIASGRRARTGTFVSPYTANPATIVRPVPSRTSTQPTVTPKVRPQTRPSMQSSSSSSFIVPTNQKPETINQQTTQGSSSIRILLSSDPDVSLSFGASGFVSDQPVPAGTTFSLLLKNGECEANSRGQRFTSSPVLRFRTDKPASFTVRGVRGFTRQYPGVLECRVINGKLAIINELGIEEYMSGLAEEPDTEPYEKQRAFAIAARSYATYYVKSSERKFPGMPYDGSDDPATFQSYQGLGFLSGNPEWGRAVLSTRGEVLTIEGRVIKPPYFSSDDGRTRSPAEAGWKTFPNAQVFTSKPDSWCTGQQNRGHGVGMSGCGALGQAKEGRSAEQILQYYYPGARIGE